MDERPVIPVNVNANDNPLAIFTHNTLRPVLKQQHTLLCPIIKNDKNLRSHAFSNFTQEKNMIFLKANLQKNTGLRNLLIGLIIGRFSLEEFDFYQKNQKEVTRRIIEMSIIRFLSEFTPN